MFLSVPISNNIYLVVRTLCVYSFFTVSKQLIQRPPSFSLNHTLFYRWSEKRCHRLCGRSCCCQLPVFFAIHMSCNVIATTMADVKVTATQRAPCKEVTCRNIKCLLMRMTSHLLCVLIRSSTCGSTNGKPHLN